MEASWEELGLEPTLENWQRAGWSNECSRLVQRRSGKRHMYWQSSVRLMSVHVQMVRNACCKCRKRTGLNHKCDIAQLAMQSDTAAAEPDESRSSSSSPQTFSTATNISVTTHAADTTLYTASTHLQSTSKNVGTLFPVTFPYFFVPSLNLLIAFPPFYPPSTYPAT